LGPAQAGLGVGGSYRPPDYTQRSRSRGFEDSPEWESRRKQIAPPPTTSDAVRESTAAKERRLLEWEAELAKREAAIADDPDAESSDGT